MKVIRVTDPSGSTQSPRTRTLFRGFAAALFLGALWHGAAIAGIWTAPPGPDYSFRSHAVHNTCVPDASGVCYWFIGNGLTVARSDPRNAPFVQDGIETINAELRSVSMPGGIFPSSTGGAILFPAEGIIGAYATTNWGTGTFFAGGVGLDNARGQVRDSPPLTNGMIDFPANSFFDVFFDLWVDGLSTGIPNGLPEVGEVLSNDVRLAGGGFDPRGYALRMANSDLHCIPPDSCNTPWVYQAAGRVGHLDPDLGTFQALLDSLPLDLFLINPDRTLVSPSGQPFGQLTQAIHTPEPGTLALLGVGLAALAAARRRRR